MTMDADISFHLSHPFSTMIMNPSWFGLLGLSFRIRRKGGSRQVFKGKAASYIKPHLNNQMEIAINR
jgi:hypothetical protein